MQWNFLCKDPNFALHRSVVQVNLKVSLMSHVYLALKLHARLMGALLVLSDVEIF